MNDVRPLAIAVDIDIDNDTDNDIGELLESRERGGRESPQTHENVRDSGICSQRPKGPAADSTGPGRFPEFCRVGLR
jgi:hypothetical protein